MTNLAPFSTPKNDILAFIEAQPHLAASTKKQYQKAIGNYLDAGYRLTDAETLQAYAAGLPKSSRAFLKAALRLWTEQMALTAKSAATLENVAAVTATLYRLEALNKAIPASAAKGQKAHIWLSQRQVKQLLDQCGSDLLGRRDRIVLGLLVRAGLRRREMCDLRFADVITQPGQDKSRTVLNIHGKGAKDRVVPISERLAAGLQDWAGLIGGPADFHYILFERVDPARNEARFYYLAWQPTLFHPLAVVRIYGRIGETQHVLPPQPFDSLADAWPLLRRIIRTRLRHGNRMMHWSASPVENGSPRKWGLEGHGS